jgi:hypothetical protein
MIYRAVIKSSHGPNVFCGPSHGLDFSLKRKKAGLIFFGQNLLIQPIVIGLNTPAPILLILHVFYCLIGFSEFAMAELIAPV